MKKRFLSMLVLLAAVVTGAWAQTWDSGDCTVSFSDGVMTVSGTGAMEDYEDYNQTPWYGKEIKTIVIESGVTSIGKYAFTSCSNLESVNIPASVTSIGEEAFYNCGMLANVYIYAPSLTTYGAMAFDYNATGRKIYVLPEAVDTYKAGWPAYAADIEAMTLYATSVKEGTEDADKWSISPNPAEEGATVSVKYSGTKKVKSVKVVKKKAAPTYTLLSAATTSDYGKVVCAAGHLHDAKTAVPDGCTAVGILGKVTETGHGLILALQNATSQDWNTINGWTSVDTYAGTTLKVLPDAAALGTNLTSYTTLGETAVSNWAVAQKSDYEATFTNLGSTINDEGTVYDGNVNAYITDAGGTAMSGGYWSATELDEPEFAWVFYNNSWDHNGFKTDSYDVRPVLGF